MGQMKQYTLKKQQIHTRVFKISIDEEDENYKVQVKDSGEIKVTKSDEIKNYDPSATPSDNNSMQIK